MSGDDAWSLDYVVSDDDDTDQWRELGLDPEDAEPADRYPEHSR